MVVIDPPRTDLQPQFVGLADAAALMRVPFDQVETWLRERAIPFIWEEGKPESAQIPVQMLMWHVPRLLKGAREAAEALALTETSSES